MPTDVYTGTPADNCLAAYVNYTKAWTWKRLKLAIEQEPLATGPNTHSAKIDELKIATKRFIVRPFPLGANTPSTNPALPRPGC